MKMFSNYLGCQANTVASGRALLFMESHGRAAGHPHNQFRALDGVVPLLCILGPQNVEKSLVD